MSEALKFLDGALDLARREKTALEAGEYAEAIELAEERGKLSGLAWNAFKIEDGPAYRGRLLELTGLQNQLAQIAAKARDGVRTALNRSRMEKKRIKGYHLAVGQALQ